MIFPVSTRPSLFLLYSLALGAAVSLAAWAVPPAPAGFELGGDAGRGKAVFERSCALCHGAAGKGDGAMAAGLAPKPQDLTDRAVMAKRSDWEVYRKALGLSPQMLSYKSLLKDQEIRDAAAYVRRLAR
jgi:mono/diheme cytochrome c family protein